MHFAGAAWPASARHRDRQPRRLCYGEKRSRPYLHGMHWIIANRASAAACPTGAIRSRDGLSLPPRASSGPSPRSQVVADAGKNSPTPSVCSWVSRRATNSTLIPGRFIRAIRPNATPFGCPSGNSTRVISTSINCVNSRHAVSESRHILTCTPQCHDGGIDELGIIMSHNDACWHWLPLRRRTIRLPGLPRHSSLPAVSRASARPSSSFGMAGAVVIAIFPSFWPVLLAHGAMQVVSGVFEPAVAALTVGLCTREVLTARMGRNAAWSRAGNIVAATLSGVIAWQFSARGVFLQVPVVAGLAAATAMTIPYSKVDLRRARGLEFGQRHRSAARLDDRPPESSVAGLRRVQLPLLSWRMPRSLPWWGRSWAPTSPGQGSCSLRRSLSLLRRACWRPRSWWANELTA